MTLTEQTELIYNNNYKVVSLIPLKMHIEMYTHSIFIFVKILESGLIEDSWSLDQI